MHQLEELDKTAQRSVATEVESAIDGGACLVDDAGRERILDLCKQVRQKAAELSRSETLQKLQTELQKAAVGNSSTMQQLDVPLGGPPLSLWDWKV